MKSKFWICVQVEQAQPTWKINTTNYGVPNDIFAKILDNFEEIRKIGKFYEKFLAIFSG